MEDTPEKLSKIKGWAIDADPQNYPGYPMQKRMEWKPDGYNWERPPQQSGSSGVMHSNERPNVTAVFGTSVSPFGLSGGLRRFAFRYGEGSYGHWLPLMLADRVSMVEALFADITRGRIPNIFAELGWGTEWKHNRKKLIERNAVRIILLLLVIALFRGRKS